MGPRVFTAREANALIPRLEEAFGRIDQLRDQLRKLKSKRDVLEMIWGDEVQAETNPDHREFLHYQEEMAAAQKRFEETAKVFSEMEIVVKSMDQGLVDFYGVIDGRLVFLCWKRGEAAVEYYHHLEEGFAGRIAIPAGELAR